MGQSGTHVGVHGTPTLLVWLNIRYHMSMKEWLTCPMRCSTLSLSRFSSSLVWSNSYFNCLPCSFKLTASVMVFAWRSSRPSRRPLSCYLKSIRHASFTQRNQLESIQGTCRLSLKMSKGDEQKPLLHCIRQQSILISDLQKCHVSQTMVSSNRYVGSLQIAWIDSSNYTEL